MKVLVLNGGSSGLKAQLREFEDGTTPGDPLWSAVVDWGHHTGCAEVRIRTAGGAEEKRTMTISSTAEVLEPLLQPLREQHVDVIGHRVVHGGRAFQKTTRITDEVRAEIGRMAEFAPEHNRLELEAIEAAGRVFGPEVPQVAVFDTAFHSTMPEAAVVYPGPYEWLTKNVRRYGFHGISHQYVSRRAAQILGRGPVGLRLISCHLGNGASLAAVRDGKSIDTTMGFTPLEGLMMGTRSGTIDPGIIIYLVRHRGYQADALDRILNKESGLKGLSGFSADMRDILDAMQKGNDRAKLAFDVYIHRLCRELGGMLTSLGGVDAVAFTAGIGENAPLVREQVCARLAFLGLKIDSGKNEQSPVDEDIGTADSKVRVLVIHTEEDLEIARECRRLMGGHDG